MKIARFLHFCKGTFASPPPPAPRSGRTDNIQPKRELVGTYPGRRSFIVNTLSLGITLNIVMKWTGHSDYKAMKPYIDIVDSIKASSMTKFDGLI